MGGFFSIDGPFYRFGSILADVIILSFIWIFFSIPLFTIGASTTALFYVTTRRISNREGYLFKDFWSSFKSNFKQSTIVWLLQLVVGGIIIINILNKHLLGDMMLFVIPVQICMFVEICFVSFYIYPIISRFDMKLKESLKTAFFMANKHIFTSITCAVLTVGVVLALVLYPLFALIAMGTFAYLASYLIIRVFKRYRPEIDKDPLYEGVED